MSGKIELEWFATAEKAHPDAPGLKRYEHIDCLVDRKHMGVEILSWNTVDLVWDGADQDDFACEVADVLAWAVLPDSLRGPGCRWDA